MSDFKEITRKIINFGKDTPLYWGVALAGEVGELCNIVKKIERERLFTESFYETAMYQAYKGELAGELADVFIYLELYARCLKIDLEQAILDKIEVINRRRAER